MYDLSRSRSAKQIAFHTVHHKRSCETVIPLESPNSLSTEEWNDRSLKNSAPLWLVRLYFPEFVAQFGNFSQSLQILVEHRVTSIQNIGRVSIFLWSVLCYGQLMVVICIVCAAWTVMIELNKYISTVGRASLWPCSPSTLHLAAVLRSPTTLFLLKCFYMLLQTRKQGLPEAIRVQTLHFWTVNMGESLR